MDLALRIIVLVPHEIKITFFWFWWMTILKHYKYIFTPIVHLVLLKENDNVLTFNEQGLDFFPRNINASKYSFLVLHIFWEIHAMVTINLFKNGTYWTKANLKLSLNCFLWIFFIKKMKISHYFDNLLCMDRHIQVLIRSKWYLC